MIALVGPVGLLLPSISAVPACLLAIGALACIHAMPIVRRESAGTLRLTPMSYDYRAAAHRERKELPRLEIRVDCVNFQGTE